MFGHLGSQLSRFEVISNLVKFGDTWHFKASGLTGNGAPNSRAARREFGRPFFFKDTFSNFFARARGF